MDWLNYHHLYYFWQVAKHGSVSAAAQELRLRQPTVSTQLKSFQAHLGAQLLHRRGRTLTLTREGERVFAHAEEIFARGADLMRELSASPRARITIGIVDIVPKLIMARLLLPLMRTGSYHLVCHEDRPEELLAQLALHRIDAVISDTPSPKSVAIQAFHHPLGSSSISLFAHRKDAPRFRKSFPRSLNDAPFLLPTEHSPLRQKLTQWFKQQHLSPAIAAEIQDSGLLKSCAELGEFIFAAPTVIRHEIEKQYGVASVGEIRAITETYYLITSERTLSHPGLSVVMKTAHAGLFPRRRTAMSRRGKRV